MGRVKLWIYSGSCAYLGAPSRFALSLFFTLAAACCLLPAVTHAQTELGSEDDLTILGTNGTALDPDTEIKGFTVFGSTQTDYTGAVVGPGNVVVNGILAVSSGAYFVDSSTFTSASKIFINDGSTGQMLRRNAAGHLEWTDSAALGDNLGNHVATTTLNMASWNLVNVSSVNFRPNVFLTSATAVNYGGVYVSTNLYVAGKYYGDGSALSGISGDNLGNHIATTTLNMSGNSIVNVASATFSKNITVYSTVTILAPDTATSSLWVSTSASIPHLYVSVAGDVGIGTKIPGEKLEVNGTIKASRLGLGTSPIANHLFDVHAPNPIADQVFYSVGDVINAGKPLLYYTTDGTNSNIRERNDNALILETQAYRNTLVLKGGYVGLGIAAPVAALHIKDFGYREGITFQRRDTTVDRGFVYIGNGTNSIADEMYWDILNSKLNIRTGPSGTDLTLALYNGRVGAGTAAPGANLHISSTSASAAQDMLKITTGTANADVFVVKGNGTVGIGTTDPGARLDIVSTGTASNIYAQIWRDGGGVIKGSMSATGYLQAVKFIGDGSGLTNLTGAGDDMGNHIATTTLNMAAFDITGVSTISASGIYISSYGVIQTTGIGLGSVVGNVRGKGAVDLQVRRITAAQVASGQYSIIGGGQENTAAGTSAVVGGGRNNATSDDYAAISGGRDNTASASDATVGGGADNIASGYGSVIAGGWNNVSAGDASAISGGWNNSAQGYYSSVPGGRGNIASGLYAWAGGYNSVSSADGSFTWSDSAGYDTQNTVVDRTVFKNRGGFLVTGSTNPAMSGTSDRGMLVTGAGRVGISTGVPGAALDVVADGSAATDFAQIWRNASGVEVASMSATGVLYATLPPGTGDNLGNHTATQALNMNSNALDNVSSMTITGAGVTGTDPLFGVAGSTMVILADGKVGIGTNAPGYKFEVKDAGLAGFQVDPQAGYVSLRINGVEVAKVWP